VSFSAFYVDREDREHKGVMEDRSDVEMGSTLRRADQELTNMIDGYDNREGGELVTCAFYRNALDRY
jgi:hypothetical protein